MAFQIGQPGVSAFMQSLLRDLDVVIQMGDHHFLPVNTELNVMKNLLLGFEDVLLDGERKRQHGSKGANRWMDQLNDSLYDIDDLLVEIKMEKQKLQPGTTSQPSNSEVRYNFQAGFLISKNIKNRLDLLVDILRIHTEEAKRLDLKRDAVQHDAIWLASQSKVRPKQGCFADEASFHGREDDKNEIIEMLLTEDSDESKKKKKRKYEVICVVGMGGLGKTTLAQLVFHDERVKKFFAARSWVCVSDVFDVNKVIHNLIESAAENAEKSDGAAHMPSGSLPALQVRLRKIINDQKFLIVLDDVWTENVLKELIGPLHFGAKGSKILVTTRLGKVAEALGNKEPYRLGRLEHAHCLKIFNDNAFGDEDGVANDEDLMKMGDEIVRKCAGVPLVAKVTGSLLKGEDEGKWKAVKDNNLWDIAYKDEDLHPGLRLSYFYLPPILKRCFEFFALFPSDFEFKQGELVQMWIAEGLIEAKEGKELEEIGDQYYNDLKGRSLIQENNMMHDMVHHLASIVCGTDIFFRDSSGFSSSTSSLQNVRHAFIQEKLELLIDSRKLRTLIYKGNICEELLLDKWWRNLKGSASTQYCLPDLPSSIGCDLKHLRYLKLRGKFLNRTPPDSICTLTNLQVLDLSHCKDLKILPQDVGKLSNLRFIILYGTDIIGLPDSVCCLSNLRVIDLSWCQSLTTLPNDVGKLSNLGFLRLERSGIIGLPDSVCCLSNLRVLDLSFCKSLTTLPNDVGKLSNLGFLRLERSGIIGLPDSVFCLSNLRVLDLSFCKSLTTLPNDVGKLSNLGFLRLERTGIIGLSDSMCCLSNLRVLDLSDCRSLTTLPNDIGNLLSLHELKLLGTSISSLPESIVNATNLRVLQINNYDDDFTLPANIGKLTKLEELERYRVGKEKGRGIDELKGMDRLKGSLTIENMENIESREEASTANLRSKKHIVALHFVWKDLDAALTGRDGEMEVRVLEALEPNAAIKSLSFKNYAGHKFPSWMSTAPLHNLTHLYLTNLPATTEMTGMDFKSLRVLELQNCPALREMTGMEVKSLRILRLDNCPALREVKMTAPKLVILRVKQCKEMKRGKLVLLPLLLDALERLECENCHLDYFVQQLKSTNASPCTKLKKLRVWVGGDNGITSLPVGWPSIFTSLEYLTLKDLPPTNFKIVSEKDGNCITAQLELLVSITRLTIRDCPDLVSLESLQLPPRLPSLRIFDCPNLRNLPYGIRDLTSLRKINFQGCPVLQIRPHHPLPLSITRKYIKDCPNLAEQRMMEDREEWKGAFGLIDATWR